MHACTCPQHIEEYKPWLAARGSRSVPVLLWYVWHTTESTYAFPRRKLTCILTWTSKVVDLQDIPRSSTRSELLEVLECSFGKIKFKLWIKPCLGVRKFCPLLTARVRASTTTTGGYIWRLRPDSFQGSFKGNPKDWGFLRKMHCRCIRFVRNKQIDSLEFSLNSFDFGEKWTLDPTSFFS